jgi:4-hydroxythreonine-4-phosphate dehydrogenase
MTEGKKHIPILAITMGDPAGIGPEIAAKALSLKDTYRICNPILIGHSPSMHAVINTSGIKLKINGISKVSDARFKFGTVDMIDIPDTANDEIIAGKVSANAGDIAFKAIRTAIQLAMIKEVDGTVTGPIQKEALNLAGHKFSGHTEIYAHYTNTNKYAMLLADESFNVIHVTTHVSLRQACDLIKKNRILEVIQLLHESLKQLGIAKPKIGVAGLNPHASDGGLFGNEERDEILPAIEEAKKSGILTEGPLPADTLFALAKGGKYDGCVAMYHDQGHIPFKLEGFDWDKKNNKMKSVRGVNITLGLPIIRTSVDHGTAFEIAGKGIASPDALMHAIEYAVKLVN